MTWEALRQKFERREQLTAEEIDQLADLAKWTITRWERTGRDPQMVAEMRAVLAAWEAEKQRGQDLAKQLAQLGQRNSFDRARAASAPASKFAEGEPLSWFSSDDAG